MAPGITMGAFKAALCLPAAPFFLTSFLGFSLFAAFLNPSSESPSQSDSDSSSEELELLLASSSTSFSVHTVTISYLVMDSQLVLYRIKSLFRIMKNGTKN